MSRVIAVDGVLCVEGREGIIGFFERGGDGWGFVKVTGNGAGGSDTYPSLQQAFNRSQRYTPWSNEGDR